MRCWQSNPYVDDEAEDEDDGSELSEGGDDNGDDGDDEGDNELSDADNIVGTEAGNDNDDDADSLHLHLDTEDLEDTQCTSIYLLFTVYS